MAVATGAVKLEMAAGLATGAATGVGVAAGHARWRHSAEVWGAAVIGRWRWRAANSCLAVRAVAVTTGAENLGLAAGLLTGATTGAAMAAGRARWRRPAEVWGWWRRSDGGGGGLLAGLG